MKIGIAAHDRWDNEVFYDYYFEEWLDIFLNNGFYKGVKRDGYVIEDKISDLQEVVRELANVLSPAQKKLFVERVGKNGESVTREDND